MSDFSGYLGSLGEYWREEISAFTVEKHISMLNQGVTRNVGGKLRKLRLYLGRPGWRHNYLILCYSFNGEFVLSLHNGSPFR